MNCSVCGHDCTNTRGKAIFSIEADGDLNEPAQSRVFVCASCYDWLLGVFKHISTPPRVSD